MGAESGGVIANLAIGSFLFACLCITVSGPPSLLVKLVASIVGSVILLILLRFVRR